MLRELISQVDCTASFRDIQQIGHMKKEKLRGMLLWI